VGDSSCGLASAGDASSSAGDASWMECEEEEEEGWEVGRRCENS